MAISKPLRFGPSSIFLVNRWILEPSTSFDIDNEEPSKNKNQWKFKEITVNLLPERVFPRWTSLCWDAPILHRLSINCFKCSTSHSGFTYKVNVSKKRLTRNSKLQNSQDMSYLKLEFFFSKGFYNYFHFVDDRTGKHKNSVQQNYEEYRLRQLQSCQFSFNSFIMCQFTIRHRPIAHIRQSPPPNANEPIASRHFANQFKIPKWISLYCDDRLVQIVVNSLFILNIGVKS